MYGKEVLMPQDILQNIPFKQTHEALKKDDQEALKKLLCGFVVRLANNIWQFSWDAIGDDKSEKRRVLKSLVYLDALITLYRMPPAFEFSMPDLSKRFRDIPEVALNQILERFCKITVADQQDALDRKKPAKPATGGSMFKFLKSKEDIKVLMLHIIGLVVHLSSRGEENLSFIASILKKQVGELKSYCHELGLVVDAKKTTTE